MLPRRLLLAAIVLVTLPGILAGSCGDRNPFEPGEFTVTPEGGTFSAGAVTVIVPAGAVQDTVDVVIGPATGAPDTVSLIGEAVSVTLNPSTTLQAPVTIRIAYGSLSIPAGMPGGTLALHRVEGGVWRSLGGTNDASGEVVSAQIESFSDFGILGRVATSISAASAEAQNAEIGTAVADPPSVLVLADDGEPLAGVAVAFEVTAGGGSVSPASVTTDAAGTATVTSWTVGSSVGTNTLTATAPGLTAVEFTAEAQDTPPPVTGLVFSSTWSTATGRSNNATQDGGVWDDFSSPHDLLEVIPAPAGFPAWMTNVLQVEYEFQPTPEGRMLVANPGNWPAPAVGQYLYYRMFISFGIVDGEGVQPAGPHHPSQNYTFANGGFIWLWKFGNEPDGTFRVLLSTPTLPDPQNNWDLVPALDKNTPYLIEWRIFRETASTFRLAVRVSDASGSLLHDGGDFLDGSQTSALSSNPEFGYTSTEQMTSWEHGNNSPAGWTVDEGTVLWGGLAVSISDDANAWIGAGPPGAPARN